MQSVNVIVTSSFEKEYRRLSKRYRSLKQDLAELLVTLKENPETGTTLGGGVYKIRIAIKSKSKGKSGGGRIISYLFKEENDLYLLTIYDKSEEESISISKIKALIAAALLDRSKL